MPKLSILQYGGLSDRLHRVKDQHSPLFTWYWDNDGNKVKNSEKMLIYARYRAQKLVQRVWMQEKIESAVTENKSELFSNQLLPHTSVLWPKKEQISRKCEKCSMRGLRWNAPP